MHRAASSSPSSPREERVGRGPRRGETNKNAPPLPSPLLHPMEEREKSRSLMQPWGNAGSSPRLKREICTEANQRNRKRGSCLRTNASRPPAAEAGLLGGQALPAAFASTALASVLRRGHP